MEAGMQQARPRPVAEQNTEGEQRSTPEVLAAAAREANGSKTEALKVEEVADATEWFLSDTEEYLEHEFQINVGSLSKKRWVTWTVRPVDADKIRRIRRQSQPRSAARRGNTTEFDEVAANIAIVVEGTVIPDVRAAALQKGLRDPADWVRARFQHKPGLLTQIAGEIMSCSGYDDEDVREVDSVLGF